MSGGGPALDHGAPGELVLGVDAGNSKTVAVIAERDGTVRGYGRAGRGDIYSAVTEEHAVAEVRAAVTRALAAAGDPAPTAVAGAAFCLAGLDWPDDFAFWRDRVDHLWPGLGPTRLLNDGFALLRAGAADGIGIAASIGTGAAVVARAPDGSEWSASFWIVDPLGGSDLGSQAWRAAARAELGTGPATALAGAVAAAHGYADVPSMLEGTTRRGSGRVHHAALARVVLETAAAGDAEASRIVAAQAEALAAQVEAAARQVGLGPAPAVVLGGSVLTGQIPRLRELAVAGVTDRLPGAQVALTPRSPVLGAVAEAITTAGGPLDAAVLARLDAATFPPDFLLT